MKKITDGIQIKFDTTGKSKMVTFEMFTSMSMTIEEFLNAYHKKILNDIGTYCKVVRVGHTLKYNHNVPVTDPDTFEIDMTDTISGDITYLIKNAT